MKIRVLIGIMVVLYVFVSNDDFKVQCSQDPVCKKEYLVK